MEFSWILEWVAISFSRCWLLLIIYFINVFSKLSCSCLLIICSVSSQRVGAMSYFIFQHLFFLFSFLLIFSANQWIGADTVPILQMKKFKLSRQSASKWNTLYQVSLTANLWIFIGSSAENILSLYIYPVAVSYPPGHNSKDTSSEVEDVDLDQPAKAKSSFSFQVVQSLSRVWLFATPQTAAHHASPSFTISWSLLKLLFIESVMPSNHLVLCRPLLLLL